MATNYAGLILDVRAEARDLVYSNPITRETLGGDQAVVDGTNKVFYLQNKNIVSGTIGGVNYGPFVTLATVPRATTGFALDALNGILTFTSAPAKTAPYFVDYFFQWFQDADYTDWIDQATLELGMAAGSFVGPVSGGGDLTPALVQYCLERYWTNRASLFANKYASSVAGGGSEQVTTVTENYLKLAAAARKKADQMRVAAYVDPGAKKKAASGSISYNIGRYTPRK